MPRRAFLELFRAERSTPNRLDELVATHGRFRGDQWLAQQQPDAGASSRQAPAAGAAEPEPEATEQAGGASSHQAPAAGAAAEPEAKPEAKPEATGREARRADVPADPASASDVLELLKG